MPKVQDYTIGTLGSHSALQILKGAHDEGFKTLVICERGKARPYRSYQVADTIIEVDSWDELDKLETRLIKEKVILIPHGSFFNAYGLEKLLKSQVLYFGNKQILP